MVMQLAGLGRRVCWLHTGALHARSTPQLQGCFPHIYAADPQVPYLEALVAAFQEQEQADVALAAAEQVSLATCTAHARWQTL